MLHTRSQEPLHIYTCPILNRSPNTQTFNLKHQTNQSVHSLPRFLEKKMSSTQFSSGETQGQSQAKTEQVVQSTKDTAHSAQDKAAGAADQSAGFLQQTGEQVKNMAQGAIDGVKSTLGVGEHSKK